jgi:S-adenosylmethionine-diacylglycerol 3-amino-3-carboxypropyl transferase
MIRRGKVFEDILYSQCWEDPQLDRIAFNIRPEDTLFSITSGGCNVLSFLLDNPMRVIALDINPHQNHLLDLKMAAFRTLDYEYLLEFVGVRDSIDRRNMYSAVRAVLMPESRTYWDEQFEKIDQGIIHCGRYEAYMRLARRSVEQLMGRRLIERLFEADDPQERITMFRDEWDTWLWWLVTRLLLSRKTMSLLFDKAFFQYIDESFSFGKHFAGRVEYALTRLPMKENVFLSYALLGKYYSEDHLPVYLRRENFEVIRSRLDRIEMVCDNCEHYFSTMPDSSIAKFNFTNIFEWMSPEAFEQLLHETCRVALDDAVMTYRNLLVFRERPEGLAETIRPRRELASHLHGRDLSFIYNNYVIEQISKKADSWATQSERCATVKQ